MPFKISVALDQRKLSPKWSIHGPRVMKNPFASWSIYASTVSWRVDEGRRKHFGGLLHGVHVLERGRIGSLSGALIRLEPLGFDEGSPIFDLVLQPRLQ